MAGFGLRLARSQGMEGFTGNLNEFQINPADTNAIFSGDAVVLNGGFVQEATGNTPGAWAGTAILGIFTGCRFIDTDGSYEFRQFWDGGANRSNIIAHIAMPPHQMYHVKLSAASDQATAVGAAAQINYVAGSTAYGDSRSLATIGAGPLIIHRLVDLPGNTWDVAEPIVEVSVGGQQGTFADA